jgi:DICT domain-containing protein
MAEAPVPGVRGARLGADDPLRGEWNVIVVGPHQAAALVARDLGDTGAEPDRRFDFAVTHDRALVVEAARSLLRCLTPVRNPAEVGA